jgi:DNA-binding response OmpR family regulator
MKIACCTPDAKAFRKIQTALPDHQVIHEISDVSLVRSLMHNDIAIVIVDIGNCRDAMAVWLRDRQIEVQTIAISSTKDQIRDAFSFGVEDYISDLNNPAEIKARVADVLRRSAPVVVPSIEAAGFRLQRDTSQIMDNGVLVRLTPREFAAAWILFANLGRYVSRRTLSVSLWGAEEAFTKRTIEQHIYRIRNKLHLGEERGLMLRTAYNHGWRLEYCYVAEAA